MNQHPIGCAAVFVHDGHGRILVGRRLRKTEIEGRPELCVPGGKIDWMEAARDAAVREVREETGLEIEIEKFVDYADDRWPSLQVHFLTCFFQAHVIGGVLTVTEPEKTDQWQWVDPATLRHLFANAHIQIPKLTLPGTGSLVSPGTSP
jgi:ADP-ribose pyrophosphatase YjhB (NUDIX family)